jgi:FAD-dependent urate hydroxylase
VVVATGRMGAGGALIPGFIDAALFPDLAAHTSDEIDFAALAGKHIAVVGAGSSAWDNAATALEQDAASVTIFARRGHLPQINKGRASSQSGFLEGWAGLSPAQKWAWAFYAEQFGGPPPHETIHRAMQHEGLMLRLNSELGAVARAGGKVRIVVSGEEKLFDFLIVGTGFDVDIAKDPLFAEVADRHARWQDRYTPPAGLANPHLAKMPYLGDGFELQERVAGATASLSRIHVFNPAAAVSMGANSSDVPGLTNGAERLSRHIMHHLFAEDFDAIMERIQAWGENELEGTPLHVNVDPKSGRRL